MGSWSATMSRDSRYYITLTVTETSYSVENNTSDVAYTLTATKTNGTGYYTNYVNNPVSVSINGTTVVNQNVAYNFQGSTPKTITLASGNVYGIGHNQDGSKTIQVGGSFNDNDNSLGSASINENLALTTIPRYFTQKPKIETQSTTTTSGTFKWTTSENAGQVKYRVDGGSEVSVFSGQATTGTFTVSNFESNTSHSIKIDAQRKDSGLWSESDPNNFATSSKTVRIKVNGETKEATPYVRVNGEWKIAVPFTRDNGQWKRGK